MRTAKVIRTAKTSRVPVHQIFHVTPQELFDLLLSIGLKNSQSVVLWYIIERLQMEAGVNPFRCPNSLLKNYTGWSLTNVKKAKSVLSKHGIIWQNSKRRSSKIQLKIATRTKEEGSGLHGSNIDPRHGSNHDLYNYSTSYYNHIYSDGSLPTPSRSCVAKKTSQENPPKKKTELGTIKAMEKLSIEKFLNHPDVPFHHKERVEFVHTMLKEQNKNYPTLVRDITPKSIYDGAHTIRLLENSGFEFDEIKKVVMWGVDHQFWSKQLLSCTNLNKKGRNGNTKYQNLYVSYLQEVENDPSTLIIDDKFQFDMEDVGLIEEVLTSPLTTKDIKELTKTFEGYKVLYDRVPEHAKRRGRFSEVVSTWRSFLYRYLEWLPNNTQWMETRNIRLFDTGHKVFRKFIRYLEEETGRDIF